MNKQEANHETNTPHSIIQTITCITHAGRNGARVSIDDIRQTLSESVYEIVGSLNSLHFTAYPEIFDFIKKNVPAGGSVLEVGPSLAGAKCLSGLREEGYEASGVQLYSPASEQDPYIYHGNWKEIPATERFDCIYHHRLGPCDPQVDWMKVLDSQLKPGGMYKAVWRKDSPNVQPISDDQLRDYGYTYFLGDTSLLTTQLEPSLRQFQMQDPEGYYYICGIKPCDDENLILPA